MSTELVAQVCRTIATADFQSKVSQALPPGVSLDRFTRVALTAIQQNPGIATKNRASLYNAVVRCAQDGLLPDGKQAALVAFGDQVQYMPMIGGLRSIAAKHGIPMATGVVHRNDHFEYELGIEPRMVHKPAPLDQDRGEPIGAWAQAKDAAGNIYLEVMGKQDIEMVRQASRSKNGDLWTKWWGEAARKTVGRRLFKSLPLASLDEREARILDAADADTDFDRATGEVREQQAAPAADAGPRRPRVLQAISGSVQAAQATVIDREPEPPADDPNDSAEADAAVSDF